MASGDITPSVPKTVSAWPLAEFTVTQLPTPAITATWFEGGVGGTSHSVRLFDTFCVGFDYAAGVFTDNLTRAISGERAKLIGLLFGAGASTPAQRQTAAVQALVTDGVITVSGAVG